ncbi:MAG: OB-fold nucleic acid binding domain-containing protein, partial [Candidatus Saccharimonadales bacterium]
MATLKNYRDERLRKLAELRQLGVDPYPAQAERTHQLAELSDKFDELEGKTVSVAGRIVGIRKFGKIAFIVIRDMSGDVQLFLKTDDVVQDSKSDGLGMKDLPLLDSGDFVQASGPVIKTQTGEISIEVKRLI